jgi:hypothetical protein
MPLSPGKFRGPRPARIMPQRKDVSGHTSKLVQSGTQWQGRVRGDANQSGNLMVATDCRGCWTGIGSVAERSQQGTHNPATPLRHTMPGYENACFCRPGFILRVGGYRPASRCSGVFMECYSRYCAGLAPWSGTVNRFSQLSLHDALQCQVMQYVRDEPRQSPCRERGHAILGGALVSVQPRIKPWPSSVGKPSRQAPGR